MGQFHIKLAGREAVVRNTFCTEGAEALWRKAFGSPVSYTFLLGLCALNIGPDRTLRPDAYENNRDTHPIEEWWKLDADTRMLHIVGTPGNERSWAPAHEGGCANAHGDGVHQRIMGYTRQPVTFNVDDNAGGIEVVSTWAEFANQAGWTAISHKPGFPALWQKDDMLSPEHGFPWDVPQLPAGYVDARYAAQGTPVLTNEWDTYFGADPIYGLPVSQQFLDDNPEFPDGWSLYVDQRLQAIDSVVASVAIPEELGGGTISGPLVLFESTEAWTGGPYYYRLRPTTETAAEMDWTAWLATSLPVKAAFLCAVDGDDNAYLVAAANFIEPLVLFPGQSLFAKYSCRMSEVLAVRDEVY